MERGQKEVVLSPTGNKCVCVNEHWEKESVILMKVFCKLWTRTLETFISDYKFRPSYWLLAYKTFEFYGGISVSENLSSMCMFSAWRQILELNEVSLCSITGEDVWSEWKKDVVGKLYLSFKPKTALKMYDVLQIIQANMQLPHCYFGTSAKCPCISLTSTFFMMLSPWFVSTLHLKKFAVWF